MRIGIDIRALVGRMWFSSSFPNGVAEYVFRIVEGLVENDRENEYILFFNSFKNPNIKILEKILNLPNVNLRVFRFPNKLFDRIARFLRWPKIDKLLGGVDIYISPHINITPLSKETKFIQVVHDLSFEVYPEFYALRKRFWNWSQDVRGSCCRADVIIAVSESTKHDIVTFYDIPEEKIKVIHEGSDQLLVSRDELLEESGIFERCGIKDGYILFLGTIEPRKNIISLIRAYEKLCKRKKVGQLVIVGAKGWSWGKILRVASISGVADNIIFTGYVNDLERKNLYSKARIFVWPSYYEGFGFPPLEAMRCGVPVITSNVSSLPEMCGDGAFYINPHDINDISRAMDILYSNEDLRNVLVTKGYEQTKKFKWNNTVVKTQEVIESLINECSGN